MQHLSNSKTPKSLAFIKGKCPQCRRGDVFTGPMYGFALQKTNEFCSNCNQRFEIEPGYFYAAMYVSYAMNMAEMLIAGIVTYYLLDGNLAWETLWTYVISILLVSIVLSPFNYRYSRIILLHWLSPKIKYKPELDVEHLKHKA
ncbi:DUF983 domain-containing protein [Pedobacter sp.]|uniref:DUF983 domain-containing protein n=1 Tax=Pedobacter sp. TaxID=1411316 RepID=UPI00396C3121